jgi:hypothetical protein
MQTKKIAALIIAIVFALTLGIRLIIAFQSPYFSGENSYFNLRQIEHIKNTGLPVFDDELSYGGRTYIFPPVFHYTIAFFSLFMPVDIASKIFPNIFASSLVIIAYVFSFQLTKNRRASLFTSYISGFIPIFFAPTVNSISTYSLAIPLIFYMLYCFIRISERKYLYRYLILLFLLPFVSTSAALVALGFLVYILFIRLEEFKQKRAELEIIAFSIFFLTWIFFIMYKKAFLFHGASVIWENIPKEMLANYFKETSLVKAIYQVGFIPLIYGIYSVHYHIFTKRDRKVYLLISFAFSIALLLWFKLIELELGMMFLAIVLALLFGYLYASFFNYLRKTRISKLSWIFVLSFIVTFFLTSVIPSIYDANAALEDSPSTKEIRALNFLRDMPDGAVLALVSEGHLITAIAQKENVADPNFLMIDDADQRYNDIKKIYTTPFKTDAIGLLNKYNVKYMLFSDSAKEQFGIEEIKYIDDECFKPIFEDKVEIYESVCKLK